MGHGHHYPQINEKNLLTATLLNFAITLAEIIGGILSNSLSLLSDALHNLSDAIALLIAWIAHRFSKKPATTQRTFGYKRLEILAAFTNAAILIAVSVYLMIEAWNRFQQPEPVESKLMIVVAVIGLFANLISVLLLNKDKGKNLNIRAAYLHLVGDTLSSVVVVIGGLLMLRWGWFWIDPLVTGLIALYILKEAWEIVFESAKILLQFSPEEVDTENIQQEIESLPDVKNVHHLHLWSLNDHDIFLEMHVELNSDLTLSKTEPIKNTIADLLLKKFHIEHLTIQFEYSACCNDELINQH